VPSNHDYRVIFNSDAENFAGSDFNQQQTLINQDIPWQGVDHSVCLQLPPLATIYLAKVEQ
jgi:1,4-alpha-glucan branching enzyme